MPARLDLGVWPRVAGRVGQRLGDEVTGVDAGDAGVPGAQADSGLLEAFANLAALSLRNAESFADRSRQAQIQRGFYRIASVLGEPISLKETFDALTRFKTEHGLPTWDGTVAALLAVASAQAEEPT